MRTRVLGVVVAAMLVGGANAGASRLQFPVRTAANPVAAPAHAGDRVVVRLRPDVARAAWASRVPATDRTTLRGDRVPALASLASRVQGTWFEPEFRGLRPSQWDSELAAFWIAHLPPGSSLEHSLDAFAAAGEVDEVSPVTVLPLEDTAALGAAASLEGTMAVPAPNDSMWSRCYWLYQASRRDLHALEAWDVTRGDSSSVIAILDSGVLAWHPDYGGRVAGRTGQAWNNPAERGGIAGVDDDGNGYVDDVVGWDFVALDSAAMVRSGEDWRDEDNDPNDFAVHGTAVAGVAAAISDNGIGIPGVAPGARVMALRIAYSTAIFPPGEVDMTFAAQALVYAVQNGATVINCSFASVQQVDLIAAANAVLEAGVPLVVASGNNRTSTFLGERDEAIAVAATDQSDRVTAFSNRGTWVDLCAPGQSIATLTLRATGTDSTGLRTPFYSAAEAGTSFSAPMVSGAVALLQSQRHAQGLPPLHPYQVLLRLKETADDISSLNTGSDYGSGRLNLERMLKDPPRSQAFAITASTVGAGVALRTQAGRGWIAFAYADSMLRIRDAADGSVVVSFPLGSAPAGGLSAADFGAPFGTLLAVALVDGRIALFDRSGRMQPGWPVDATTRRGITDAMPALGDLDGDGRPEVVWGGDDGSVWAWDVAGVRVPGFPRNLGSSGTNLRLALGNLDGVPGLEVVVATSNSSLHALRGDGTPMDGWWVTISANPVSPVIARLGTDPRPCVIVAAGLGLRAYWPDSRSRFVVPLASVAIQEIAVGDLNGDGRNEIVAMGTGPESITVYDSSGVVLQQRTLPSPTSGPPLIAPLTSGTGAQILFANRDSQARYRLAALTYANGLPELRGWPKPGHPGNAPGVTDLDGDSGAEVLAGSGTEGLEFVYDAGAGSWRPGVASFSTPRANFARTGSLVDPPPTGVLDDLAPLAVADLAGTVAGTREATLQWTAPADAGPGGQVFDYDVRISPVPFGPSEFGTLESVAGAPLPSGPGSPETFAITGLPEGLPRWYAVRSRDRAGNWSAISNVTQVTTASVPPREVSDLRVVSGADTTLMLAWTAPGDDGAIGSPALYRVRWSAVAPLDSAAFEVAPGVDLPAHAAAGESERAVVGGLERGKRYFLALRAVDAAGNASAISNQVAPLAGRLAARSGAALLPSRLPARSTVDIEWQADPASAGSPQHLEVFDLGGRRLARFALPAAPGGVVRWDGRDGSGARVGAGVYFARLVTGSRVVTTRLVLLR